MTRRALLPLLLLAVAATARPAVAQDLTGTWTITSETPMGSMTQTLTLEQDGSALTGTLAFQGGGRRGGGGGGGGRGPGPIEITDGIVEGSTFRFTVTFEFGGRGSLAMSYSGSWDGDSMEGTVEGGRGGGRPFTATRGG